jgi:hypothetical protein
LTYSAVSSFFAKRNGSKSRITQKNQSLISKVDSSEVTEYGGGLFFLRMDRYHQRFLIIFPTNPCFAASLSHHSTPSRFLTPIFCLCKCEDYTSRYNRGWFRVCLLASVIFWLFSRPLFRPSFFFRHSCCHKMLSSVLSMVRPVVLSLHT